MKDITKKLSFCNNTMNNSMDQSVLSVKSGSIQMRGLARSEIERLEKVMKKNSHKKLKSLPRRLLIGIICCIVISACFTCVVESSKLICRQEVHHNKTIYTVRPPEFLTYVTMTWLLVFIPIYLYVQYLKRGTDKDFLLIQTIRKSTFLFACDHNHYWRSILFYIVMAILWHTMFYCWFHGAIYISGLNITTIFCFHCSLNYLLQWVALHKKFIAIRIVGFILSASGIIINIYSIQGDIWEKVLLTTGTSIMAAVGVFMKYCHTLRNSKDNGMILGVIGLLNTLFTWPIFLGLSVVTNLEPLVWSKFSWGFLFGISFGILGILITLEIASRYTTRFTRSLHFVLAIPTVYLIDKYWLKDISSENKNTNVVNIIQHREPTAMEISSIIIIIISLCINAIPNKFLTIVVPVPKVRQVTGRRVSLATRSQLLGNNTNVGGGGGFLGNGTSSFVGALYSSLAGVGGSGRDNSVVELKMSGAGNNTSNNVSRQVSIT